MAQVKAGNVMANAAHIGRLLALHDDSSGDNGEMRFVCASKYGGDYTLRITIRKDPSGALLLDASASTE